MVFAYKVVSRRKCPLGKRDLYGLNAMDRLNINKHSTNIKYICCLLAEMMPLKCLAKVYFNLKLYLIAEYLALMNIFTVEVPNRILKPVYPRMTFDIMENKLQLLGLEWSQRFRFQSKAQLVNLKVCFRLPDRIVHEGSVFNSEEVILIALTRFEWPFVWDDMKERFPGRSRDELRRAFYWFLDFMIVNWGYLLVNNMPYWKDYLPHAAEAIRQKLMNLNYPTWRQFHPPAHEPNGFRVALFIDNTMYAFCRPGGNTREGPASPRVPLEVQQAWWTGWKKLHGMKWQTCILPNGMDFDIYGPESVRRNDLTTLDLSNIEARLAELQANDPIKFKICGDSAYFDSDQICRVDGRGMSSVRESAEHSYCQGKDLWKYTDYKHVLQLYKQPIAKIIFVTLLLRNAYVTMNASQISEYFLMAPPTLADWTFHGPKARPLPSNCIFSPNYVRPHNFEDNDDVEDEEEDED